jgi:hypothetical protein
MQEETQLSTWNWRWLEQSSQNQNQVVLSVFHLGSQLEIMQMQNTVKLLIYESYANFLHIRRPHYLQTAWTLRPSSRVTPNINGTLANSRRSIISSGYSGKNVESSLKNSTVGPNGAIGSMNHRWKNHTKIIKCIDLPLITWTLIFSPSFLLGQKWFLEQFSHSSTLAIDD